MNIFYVDEDPIVAAKSLADKHVVKMIVETAQLLSTAHHVLDDTDEHGIHDKIYKKTHMNHPSAVWVRESLDNYLWAWDHLNSLLGEYTHRYGKIHKTEDVLWSLISIPYNIKEVGFTPPPQCMPDEYKTDDTVTAYRNYYNHGKKHLHKWTNREPPAWIS
jgi:Pyrimidine dimer DNA glycosylase